MLAKQMKASPTILRCCRNVIENTQNDYSRLNHEYCTLWGEEVRRERKCRGEDDEYS
jgi:hypothetical protein